jgi:spermidine synthase
MGFSGLVAEIVLLRELMIVFSGNELCIGVVLANWLILEAFGCFFLGGLLKKSKNKPTTYTLITVLFSFSFLAAVFLIRMLKHILGVSIGESIGLLPLFYSSFLILLPVSILHGSLFPFSCQLYYLYSGREATSAAKVYVYETVGTIIGGIICTYLFVLYLNTVKVAFLLLLVNAAACTILLTPYRQTGLFQKSSLGLLSALILFSSYMLFSSRADELHRFSIQAQWKNLPVVHYGNSPYGNICVVKNEGQYIYFIDGVPEIMTPIPDMPSVEEFVHIPLLAHPNPEEILIVSGGAGGVINEALKHPSIESVRYAELDPMILSLLRKFSTSLTESELTDDRVQIDPVDGRLLLKTTSDTYDLIFIGIEDPANLQANRFFTREFFSLAEKRLNQGGILVLEGPGSLTLLNEELKNINGTIFHTLDSVFSHIRVMPGDGGNVFLSSDSPDVTEVDTEQIVKRLKDRNITAEVIVPRYIKNKLHQGWQRWFFDFIAGSSEKINYDFKPLAMYYSIAHWNALFAPAFGQIFNQFERIQMWHIVVLFLLFLLLFFLFRSRNIRFVRSSVPFSILSTGFAGMIFDLVVIFAFQSLYGYVFSWIGILVALFMAGAACGAFLITRIRERIQSSVNIFKIIELIIICFSLVLPFVFIAGENLMSTPLGRIMLKVLFLIIPFLSGSITGSQFPLGNFLYIKLSGGDVSRTAGLLYASDLVGGWAGGIVGAVVLLPVLGLTGTCMTVGLMKLTSFIVFHVHSSSPMVKEGKNG